MQSDRRGFLKLSGLAGLVMLRGRTGIATEGENLAGAVRVPSGCHWAGERVQRFNMSGYAAAKIDPVRVGIIGLGQRGPAHLKTLIRIEGVEIKALCDLLPEKAEAARMKLKGTDHRPELYSGDQEAWKKLCERDDIDLVVIATPWPMHAEMGIYAMNCGKHAASEVPAAGTIEECWQIVETAERTRKHFMMMENYSFVYFPLLILNMARKGFFGEIIHGDCAYNTSKMRNNFSKTMYWDMWWLKQYAWRKGNIYPTHGLGPICQVMDINRGDRLDYLVSVESADFMMNDRAKELARDDEFYRPFVDKDYRGSMNVTTIRTNRGRTIMVQHDAASPSPHNMIHGVYGTKGAALYDPPPPRFAVGKHKWVAQEEFDKIKEKYTPEITRKLGRAAKGWSHWGSDLLQDWRLIDCLRNGLPLEQDVYDAVSWSSIVPLSEWSVRNRSNSIDVPDFTAGSWKTNQRNMDINLERGGDTKVLG